MELLFSLSEYYGIEDYYIYIMHKKGTSLRLPVLFTKFRPPKIKRKIFVAKSLSTIKNSPIL